MRLTGLNGNINRVSIIKDVRVSLSNTGYYNTGFDKLTLTDFSFHSK